MNWRSTTTTNQNPTSSFTPIPTGFLQRKGTFCSQRSINSGESENCTQQKNSLQRKLTIGASNDPLEQEADRIAVRVLATPTNTTISTAPPHIQRFTGQTTNQAEVAPASVDRVLSSSGRPLEPGLQQEMSQRFGHDFSRVRVHTGAEADRSAREVNANAYTVGNDIVFGTGKFSPNSNNGKRLLAHELVHTLQQQGNYRQIQCQPKPNLPSDKTNEANDLEKRILANPIYLKLTNESKATVLRIIAQSKTKDIGDAKGQRNYYLKKLEIAITTPFNGTETGKAEYGCSSDADKKNRETVKEALKIEEHWGGAYSDVDEKQVATGTNKVNRRGQGGKLFTVDRSDPRNIRAKIKIKLNGKPDEVSSIKKLEDAIERAVSIDTKGYYLDIEFVNTRGLDVFEFTVNFCEWPNSGNWASSPVTLSHEVHHALGLDDRYDYIESHAHNSQMNVPMRLVWFDKQMMKSSGPRDSFSKMDTSSNPLLAEDVCAVAFSDGPERTKCIEARKDMDLATVPPI
jgi:hypothetical protein